MRRAATFALPALLACSLVCVPEGAVAKAKPRGAASEKGVARKAKRPASTAKVATAALPEAWPGVAGYEALPAALAGGVPRDPARALALADEVLKSATGRPAALAQAARGLALYRRGRYREAAVAFAAIDRRRLAVADLVSFYEAEARFHAGEYAAAEKLLRGFGEAWPESPWRHRAAFRLADCELARDFHASGIATLKRLLAEYPEFPHRAAMHVALAHAEVKRGRLNAAAGELRRVLREWPGDPLAIAARRVLEGLEAQGAKAEEPDAEARFAQAVDLRRRKYYGPALTGFQAMLTDASVSGALRRRVRRQIARTLFDMERFEESLTSFTALVKDAPDAGERRHALRWKAHCLERLGRLADATEALRASWGGEATPQRLSELAWLHLNGASYEKAAELFAQVAKSGGRWELNTRWWRAWLAYRLGDYDTAIEAFKRLQAASKKSPDQYAYWLARALARKGEIEAAVDTYRGLIASMPLSYYALQARERLREIGRPLEDAATLSATASSAESAPDEESEGTACEADDEERAGCEARATSTAAESAASTPVDATTTAPETLARAPDAAPASPEAEAPKASPPAPKPETPGADALDAMARQWGALFPGLVAAQELHALGEDALAATRLRAVSDELSAFRNAGRPRHWRFRPRPYLDNRKGPPRGEWGRELDDSAPDADPRRASTMARGLPTEFWRGLGASLLAVGDHHYARRHRLDRSPLRGAPEDEDENDRWAARYPRAYREVVEAQAAHYGLEPYFLWALMTQESIYNPLAVSHADARGLMQVMPYTGTLIADRMAWRNFGPALLFEPRVVVEMSAWYFHQLLTKFNGQLPLAIAGYNAGPHRVAAWLKRKGHLPMDEFIEEIPYTEARGYTKKVLHYLALYRRIYEREPGLSVSQVIDPAFQDNINF